MVLCSKYTADVAKYIFDVERTRGMLLRTIFLRTGHQSRFFSSFGKFVPRYVFSLRTGLQVFLMYEFVTDHPYAIMLILQAFIVATMCFQWCCCLRSGERARNLQQ